MGTLTSSDTGTGQRVMTAESGVEPPVGQHGGVDAAGQIPEFGQRGFGLLVRLVHQLPGPLGVRVEALARPSEIHRQRHQSLLGAVVQVPLDTEPFRLRTADGSAAAELELIDPPSKV